jgi:hypothetical protein
MSSPQTSLAPIHATPMGVRVWLVPPGDRCLIWSGDHDLVRLAPVISNGHGSAVGAPVKVVSSRCLTEADARTAVARWVTGAGYAIVEFDSDDLAAGFYEDDELTAEGTDQATGEQVVVRAGGPMAAALRACALAGRDCAIPAGPDMILTRTAPGTNPGPVAAGSK